MSKLINPARDAAIIELGAAPFFDGFRPVDVSLASRITIRAALGGQGPPLLLLHGHPQTHVTWRKVAAEYLRCYNHPATRHAICEDYRAAATIDLEHDAEDADARIKAPLLAIWGANGTVGALYDVLETWREKATQVAGRALPCGHAVQEEQPNELLAELKAFFLI
jgi:pimeloyl-ACP methyl ester carboxylesterase